MNKELRFLTNASFETVLKDGFSRAGEKCGFEYTVGSVRNGKVKVIFEPDKGDHESLIIDCEKSDDMAFCLVTE